jgi:hypothetical protein
LHLPERCEIGQARSDEGRFQFEVALLCAAWQSEGEIVVGIGRAGSRQQIAGRRETGGRCGEFGKSGEHGIRIGKGIQPPIGCFGVEKATADAIDGLKQGSDGKGVEAALELGAASKDRFTAIAWRLAGFVVGDAGNVAGCRKVEAVDAAAYAQVCSRNDNRSQWIPRKRCALLWCEIAGAAVTDERDLRPAPLAGDPVV